MKKMTEKQIRNAFECLNASERLRQVMCDAVEFLKLGFIDNAYEYLGILQDNFDYFMIGHHPLVGTTPLEFVDNEDTHTVRISAFDYRDEEIILYC